jgi:hypothetical protein
VATAPLANELAGATVAAVLVPGLALVLAVALAPPLAVPDAEAVGLAGKWCLPNPESATVTDPLRTAMTAPIATAATTGMAIAAAVRARRLLRERRRAAGR